MRFVFIKIFLLIYLATSALYAQDNEREQGLLTITPYWRQALGGNVLSLPHVQAQSAVVALDGGSIKAYSTTGTPMWSYGARGRLSPFVSRSREGTSYFSRTNGTFFAINRAGRELWRRNLEKPLAGKVIPGWDGRLFVPVDKKLFCYTAAGTLLWTLPLDQSYQLPPKLDRNGGVIFALKNRKAYQVDPFGKYITYDLSANPIALIQLDKQRFAMVHTDGTLEILGESDDWYLHAGEDTQASVLPRIPGRPVAVTSKGNYIAGVNNLGEVVLIGIDERKTLWTGDSHMKEFSKKGIFSRPDLEAEIIFDDRGIYILSKDGATGFSMDGKRLWFTFLTKQAAVPAFGDDGVLYAGGKDWILYAYKIEDRALPRTASRSNLFGPAPEGSYGTGTPKQALMPKIPIFEDEIDGMLNDMQIKITNGDLGDNELSYMSFLLTLSADTRKSIQNRVRAIQILGQFGSRETVPWLVNIFRRDSEPLVRAAAATAIGDIGVDPEGMAINVFLQSLQGNSIKDEQVLLSLTKATGDICRFSGPPLSETGIRILNLIINSNQPAGIRTQAERELASLR